MIRIAVLGLIASLFMGVGAAQACDGYVSIATEDMKAYRDKLSEAGADPLDQLYAFQQLVCSDNPTIRAYAIRTGLTVGTDPLLRAQVLLDAMLAKHTIEIEVVAGKQSTADDKDWLKTFGGIVLFEVRGVSAVEGCVDVVYQDECTNKSALFVTGTKVQFYVASFRMSGQFELSESNELVGTIQIDRNGTHGLIPAVIKLF
jgi:hypothetical protein